MADLDKINGTGETGATARTKINASFTKIDTTTDNTEALLHRTDGIDNNTGGSQLNIAKPMVLEGSPQPVPNPVTNEFATFSAIKTIMETPRETYSLVGNAPKMKMEITSPSGVGAEMEVKYGATQVASMQWNKINQEFVFNLSDKDTGASKAQFAIKPDGKAYVSYKEVVTTDFYSYDFIKIPSEITVAGTSWEDALILNTTSKPIGVYELKWEILYTMNTVSKSAKFRYSIDDGATWAVLTREIKDKTNENTINIWFPYEITAPQEFKLKVQVAKEDASSVMKCKFGSIVVERKK